MILSPADVASVPTKAYDFFPLPPDKLTVTNRGILWENGWMGGLPPAFPEAWPVCPRCFWPMRHAWTLKVPDEYQVFGPEFVAISFFAQSQDNYPKRNKLIEQMVAEKSDDQHLVEIRAGLAEAPGRHVMQAITGEVYVAYWLTAEQFSGELRTPPDISKNPLLQDKSKPVWLDPSLIYKEFEGYTPRTLDNKKLPELTSESGWYAAYPLGMEERQGDPNIGKPAREFEHQNEKSGYIPIFSSKGEELNLRRFWNRMHFGGTMTPSQGYPEYGPFYLEFLEYFGALNFGGGAAQIDLPTMQLDWAC